MPASNPSARLACYGHALAGRALQVRLPRASDQIDARDEGAALPCLTLTNDGSAQLRLPELDSEPSAEPSAGHAAPVSQLAWAATAHAAAHLQHGQAAQPRDGLKPVQIALLGVLEDARVEHAMLRDCPGLRALWIPQHSLRHDNSHNGFDAMLARLSLCLLNPAYTDPHPWIARVRACVMDALGQVWKVDTFQGLRVLASVLGNEIGQLRLPFDNRNFAGVAAYRDDNRHLWLPQELDAQRAAAEKAETSEQQSGSSLQLRPPAGEALHYPEWDQRIGRMRQDWCRVLVRETAERSVLKAHPSPAVRRLARGMALHHGGLRMHAGLSDAGQHLHPMAAVDAHLDRIRGLTPDLQVFRGERQAPQALAVFLLLDTSQSIQSCALEMHTLACNAASALEMLGHRTALWTLSSEGRSHVGMRCLKNWGDSVTPLEINGTACSGSSRLGAGVRHALAEHAQDARKQPGWRRMVVIVTDGELHDIDVHDPAYLYGDLAHCRAEAVQMQVTLRGLLNSASRASRFRSVVGAENCAVAASDRMLPSVLKALLAR